MTCPTSKAIVLNLHEPTCFGRAYSSGEIVRSGQNRNFAMAGRENPGRDRRLPGKPRHGWRHEASCRYNVGSLGPLLSSPCSIA